MASGGRRPGGDKPWWVTGIKVVAGLGAAAVGVYAAARAAEAAFQEEPPVRSTTSSGAASCSGQNKDEKHCNSDYDDDSDDEWVDINDDDEYSDSSQSDHGLLPMRSSRPLVDLLEEFYQKKVKIPDGEMTAITAAVDQVAQSIDEYIHSRHANLVQGNVFVGNAELAVQHSNRFVVILPLELEANLWKMVDASNTVLKAPGYSLIHRINTDFFRPGSSVWDRFTVGTYLNSELIQRFLEGVLQKVANKGFTFSYDDFYVAKSDKALTLEIMKPVGGLIDHLTIQVIPSVTLEDTNGTTNLEGISHGCLSEPVRSSSRRDRHHGESNPYENLWHQSCRTKELEMIQTMDEVGGCCRKCLQILQAIASNPLFPLSLLSDYQLQTVLLHLCEEESEWEDVMLAERFLDILKRLDQFLEDGRLPHLYHTEMNLFEGFSSRQLLKMKTWLEKRLKQPDRIHTLLM